MPFNFRKTKTMKLENGNYGTGAGDKSDQGKYEAKVKKFLGYCKDFNNLLVRMGNKGEIRTVGDIITCFNSSFKEYYKDSKKYSLFSHTTKVLKGMEKKLKNLAKKGDKGSEGPLTINGMAGDLKKAFDYKPKRSSDAEKGKRSAIDDRAVYGFFTATLPKTLTSLCKKAKEEAVEALEEQNDIIDLIKKSFGDLDELCKGVRKTVENAKRHSLHQEEQIEEIKAQQEVLHQTAEEHGTKGDQQAVGEQGDDIKELEEKRNKIDERAEKLKEELEKKTAISNSLGWFSNKDNFGEWVTEEKNDKKGELMTLLGINKEISLEELIDALDKKLKELSADLDGIKAKAEGLKKESAGIDSEIKKIKEEQNKLGKEIKKGKETQEKKFNLVKETLTINGQDGLKAYYDVYVEDVTPYRNNTTSITMNNIGNISKVNAENLGGLFHSFEKLVSVKTSNLSGTISEGAFNQCYNLESFNESGNYKYIIPESVGTIGDSAFAEAGKKVADGFSANVESETIGKDAFQNSGLSKINLPNATTIKEGAFTGCNKLTEVTLGQDNLDNISEKAFDNNDKLIIYVKTGELQEKLKEKLKNSYRGNVEVKSIEI